MQPGETAVVSFTVVVQAIPPQNPIFNVAQAEYTYMPFPGYEVRGIETSNIATCYIYGELVAVAKSADKALATAGETINYTSVVTNGGNGSLINLVFRDPVPAGTAFVPGSVTVNGVSLTVCDSKESSFRVAIIPYTFEHTNFCRIEVGSVVNLEFDIVGKYIARLMQQYTK